MKKTSFIIALLSGLAVLANAQPINISTLAGRPTAGTNDGAGVAAQFNRPSGLAVDAAGNIFVADTANHTIRKITPAGVVSTFAGLGGVSGIVNNTGANARFFAPQGVAVDNNGNVYVADTANSAIRKITSLGVVSTFAGSPGVPNSYDGIASLAQFNQPQGIAVDGAGNLYVSDTWNHTIRKITPAAVTTTLAGLAGNPGSADGTNSKARFRWPSGIALDGATNIYVADFLNHVIRKITPSGTVSTIAGVPGVYGNNDGTNSAARFYQPYGITVDTAGKIFVVDSGNQSLRKISASGTNWIVTTVAGLSVHAGNTDDNGSLARVYFPGGLAADGFGHIYFADAGNNSIRTDRLIPPSLQLTRRPNESVLSWPIYARNFGLETASDITGNPLWTSLTNGIAVTSDSLIVTNSVSTDSGFFRLHKP